MLDMRHGKKIIRKCNLIVLICDNTERRLSDVTLIVLLCDDTERRWKCHLIVLICDNTERRLSESVIWLSWYAITRKEDYQKVSLDCLDMRWHGKKIIRKCHLIVLICDDTERRLSESVIWFDNTERRLSEGVNWLSWYAITRKEDYQKVSLDCLDMR